MTFKLKKMTPSGGVEIKPTTKEEKVYLDFLNENENDLVVALVIANEKCKNAPKEKKEQIIFSTFENVIAEKYSKKTLN